MKLILKEKLENLGEEGEVVDVKPGYARNYLLPRGLAYEASAENLERIERERREAEERSRRDYLEARRRASKLEDQVLVFGAKASEEGKLFGSVTSADITDQLNERGGLDFELEKRSVLLDEPLKTLGVSNVEIRLHPEVVIEVEVRVEREED
ncbi:MAG: 50S ribosomal protein L9 [Longimicrobiales bacterium]|nr:50S ribosomal protein L9 [Longimicrobiales bacterium]